MVSAPSRAAAGAVTAVFDGNCENYGFDVTNHDSVAHTVTLTVGNTAQPPVVIQPGQTTHVPLDPSTEAATQVTLTDSDGTVIADLVVRFCIETVNTSVTIKANTGYTLKQIRPIAAPPAPQHGTVVRAGKNLDSLRYTPDSCFSGIDSLAGKTPSRPPRALSPSTCCPARAG
jgi:hypothetical protein